MLIGHLDNLLCEMLLQDTCLFSLFYLLLLFHSQYCLLLVLAFFVSCERNLCLFRGRERLFCFSPKVVLIYHSNLQETGFLVYVMGCHFFTYRYPYPFDLLLLKDHPCCTTASVLSNRWLYMCRPVSHHVLFC